MADIRKWVERVERGEFWGPRQKETVVHVQADHVREQRVGELALDLTEARFGIVTDPKVKVSTLTRPVRDEGARNMKWLDRIRRDW